MKVTTDACILGAWAPAIEQGKILDIGTGTGLLALMLAQRCNASIDAIELDDESFFQANENINASQWKNRISLIHDDVRNFSSRGKYDLIICNPPFFEQHLLSRSPKKNIARHDVKLNTTELLATVKRLLNMNGKFTVLLPYLQSNEFVKRALVQELFPLQQLLIRDQLEKEIKRSVLVFGFEEALLRSRELSIKDVAGNYSEHFIKLMQAFYLFL